MLLLKRMRKLLHPREEGHLGSDDDKAESQKARCLKVVNQAQLTLVLEASGCAEVGSATVRATRHRLCTRVIRLLPIRLTLD